jgi:hypothetical protein
VAASNKPAILAPPLGDLDDTRPARWGLPQVALIAAFLVVLAAGWSLYVGDLANDVGLTIPPATQAGDDLAQVRQALEQERDKSEKVAGELQAATAASKNAAHGQLNEVQRALQQEHDKADQLARELAAAWRALRSQATAMADNGPAISSSATCGRGCSRRKRRQRPTEKCWRRNARAKGHPAAARRAGRGLGGPRQQCRSEPVGDANASAHDGQTIGPASRERQADDSGGEHTCDHGGGRQRLRRSAIRSWRA